VNRFQQGSLFKVKRKGCSDVWVFRWYDYSSGRWMPENDDDQCSMITLPLLPFATILYASAISSSPNLRSASSGFS